MYRVNGLAKKSNVRSVDERFFESWSNDMAYVLGFFAADGCLTKNAKRHNYYIEFVSTDLEIIEKIRNAMSANQRITTRKHSNKNWKQAYRIQIGSKKLFDDLMDFGFTPKKSNTMILPKIPNEYFSDFLRGYFDGDGCISKGKYLPKDRKKSKKYLTLRFTSGSIDFLEGIKSDLKNNARIDKCYIYKKLKAFELVYSTLDALRILRYIYYANPELKLLRKYEKAMDILSERGSVA